MMGALVKEEVGKGVTGVQVSISSLVCLCVGHIGVGSSLMIENNLGHCFTLSTFTAWFQVDSGKLMVNKDICVLMGHASRIAAPCLETLGKVNSARLRMVLMMTRQVRNNAETLVMNADTSAWNYDEDGKEGWSGEPEEGEKFAFTLVIEGGSRSNRREI